MKAILSFSVIATLLLALVGISEGQVPRKPVPSAYSSLWQDSPFTAKPVTVAGVAYNILNDYVLIGVGPAEKGHRVTLLNSKQPKDGRIIIRSGVPNQHDIMIDEVMSQGERRDSNGMLPTKVRIKDSSGNSAVVGFDKKFLSIKAPAPAAAPMPAQRPSAAPTTGPPQQNGEVSGRKPRVRTVPSNAANKPTLTQQQIQQLRNRIRPSTSGQSNQNPQSRRPIIPPNSSSSGR
ncbi:MAG: hypothetical protein ACPGIA_01440 [Luteolibacter sp.]